MAQYQLIIAFILGSCNFSNTSTSVNEKITIDLGKGRLEIHEFDSINNTHTIEYKSVKDSFYFNDNSLSELFNVFAPEYVYGIPRTPYYEFRKTLYRKRILSLDGKNILFDSMPNISKRVWSTPKFTRTKIIDRRPRRTSFGYENLGDFARKKGDYEDLHNFTFPVHDFPKHLRSKYNFSGGLIKETYKDSFYKYELVLNAATLDTLYFTSQKVYPKHSENQKIVRKHYDFSLDFTRVRGKDIYDRILVPPLIQELTYENSMLQSDRLYFKTNKNKILLMSYSYTDTCECNSLFRFKDRRLYNMDSVCLKYHFSESKIRSFDYYISDHEISVLDYFLNDTTSSYYIGRQASIKYRDSFTYNTKYSRFTDFPILNCNIVSQDNRFQPNHPQIELGLSSNTGKIFGFIYFPYGIGYEPYAMSSPTEISYNTAGRLDLDKQPITTLRKEGKIEFINYLNGFVGGIVIDKYQRPDSAAFRVFRKNNWKDKNNVPNYKPQNNELAFVSLNENHMVFNFPYSKWKFDEIIGRKISKYWKNRRDRILYDSIHLFDNSANGIARKSHIEKPNNLTEEFVLRIDSLVIVNKVKIEEYNRYITNVIKNKYQDYSFHRSVINNKESSVTEYIESYIPYYNLGFNKITHTWNGHQENAQELTFNGPNQLPNGNISSPDKLERNWVEKQITEKWQGDTLFLSEKNKASEYKAVMVKGLVHSINYIKDGITIPLVYWEVRNGKLELKSNYSQYPEHIKKMVDDKPQLINNTFVKEDYNCQILQKYALMHYLRPNLKIE
jgi:hypothetical protein